MGPLVLAILWWAPCPTDQCLEVDSRPAYGYASMAECEAAAAAVRKRGLWWAWCEPAGDPA